MSTMKGFCLLFLKQSIVDDQGLSLIYQKSDYLNFPIVGLTVERILKLYDFCVHGSSRNLNFYIKDLHLEDPLYKPFINISHSLLLAIHSLLWCIVRASTSARPAIFCTYVYGGIQVKTHIWNLSGPIQVNCGNRISRKQKSHKRRRECI